MCFEAAPSGRSVTAAQADRDNRRSLDGMEDVGRPSDITVQSNPFLSPPVTVVHENGPSEGLMGRGVSWLRSVPGTWSSASSSHACPCRPALPKAPGQAHPGTGGFHPGHPCFRDSECQREHSCGHTGRRGIETSWPHRAPRPGGHRGGANGPRGSFPAAGAAKRDQGHRGHPRPASSSLFSLLATPQVGPGRDAPAEPGLPGPLCCAACDRSLAGRAISYAAGGGWSGGRRGRGAPPRTCMECRTSQRPSSSPGRKPGP